VRLSYLKEIHINLIYCYSRSSDLFWALVKAQFKFHFWLSFSKNQDFNIWQLNYNLDDTLFPNIGLKFNQIFLQKLNSLFHNKSSSSIGLTVDFISHLFNLVLLSVRATVENSLFTTKFKT
jgi:hypothetical protein